MEPQIHADERRSKVNYCSVFEASKDLSITIQIGVYRRLSAVPMLYMGRYNITLYKEIIMIKTKRIIIATLSGVIFGFVCFGLASSGPSALPWPVAVQLITSRTLIGFAIGISALSLGHWSIHGLVMGLIFSIPLAFGGFLAPDNPEFSKTGMFTWTIILGMIYGLLIELITSLVFKAKQEK